MCRDLGKVVLRVLWDDLVNGPLTERWVDLLHRLDEEREAIKDLGIAPDVMRPGGKPPRSKRIAPNRELCKY
jgi:hypothetical protein